VSKLFLFLLSSLACAFAHAESVSNNGVFAQALVEGTAIAPAPTRGELAPVIQHIQAITHDYGTVFISAKRLFRFKQQARCGRVIFTIVQPSSNAAFPGGQLNVCEDGMPPWRICKDKPGFLIAPRDRCADNSEPKDTAEVAQAIKDALAKGDMSREQVMQQLKEGANKKGVQK
jgi:hypothetical protein